MKQNRLERLESALSQVNRMHTAKDLLASLKYLQSGTGSKIIAAISIIEDAEADVIRRINKNINN